VVAAGALAIVLGGSPPAAAQDPVIAPGAADRPDAVATDAHHSVAPIATTDSETHAADPSPTPDAAEQAPPSPSTRLSWPSYARRRPGYLELGVGGGLAALGVAIPILRKPDDARWTGGVAMDGWVRRRFHLSESQRDRAVQASDGLLYSTLAIPFLEVSIGALAGRVDGDLALRMTLVGLQAFGMAGFVTGVSKVVTARERPYGERCASEPDAPGCGSSARYVSFFSGHTSLAFTAAGLSCVMHQNLHLYGQRGLDAAACGLALGAATATGAMRVVGDQHWTSDILMGAGVGLISGWLVPYLLYFRGGDERLSDADEADGSSGLPQTGLRSGVVAPWANSNSAGLSYGAVF